MPKIIRDNGVLMIQTDDGGCDIDVVLHVYRNQTYYIGEEAVYNSFGHEIGYVCSRGDMTVIAASVGGKTINQRLFVGAEGEEIESEDDVIRVIDELHAERAAQ